MHISFDLYPNYLRNFDQSIPSRSNYRLLYDIYAMRNYEYRKEEGRRIGPFPQVRKEGSLELICQGTAINNRTRKISVRHERSWSTWTNQPHASKQTIDAEIDYTTKDMGSPKEWTLSYRSKPILPVKSFRHYSLDPMHQSGKRIDHEIEIRTSGSSVVRRYKAKNNVISLYTLTERLQANAISNSLVDYLDDLSMFRPNMEIVALPDQRIEIEGSLENLHGFALVGPAFLPLYFWQNDQNHVLAIIGRNVAYTLKEILV